MELKEKFKELSEYAIDREKKHVETLVKSAMGNDEPVKIEYPPGNIEGDLAIPCFTYAKTLRKAPPLIAKELAEKINVMNDEHIESAVTAGGYLNIILRKDRFINEVFKDFRNYGDNYGISGGGKDQTVIIEYSSPNVAKPFSVGNIRSTIIGQAVRNIFDMLGYKTISINHIGDWGTQFGKLIYAYQMWGNENKVRENPIRELLALYVRFHQELKTLTPEEVNRMEDEARRRFKLLEEGNEECTHLWKWFIEVSLSEFQKIYDRLNVKFDYVLGESFYNDKTDEVIRSVEELPDAERDPDGLLLVKLDKYSIDTPILLQRSDGATLYATRDMAALLYRIRQFAPNLIVYVVGGEQKLHFQQVFQTLELLGYHSDKVHVDFGLVSLKEGKMSTREGRVIFFEDLLQEAYNRALAILAEKRPELEPEERAKIAEVVGIGAIKFNDLSQNRVKNIVFDWDKMLSFDGDTAPYLQYSYARVQSILRKAGVNPEYKPELLKEKEEIELIKALAKFPETIRDAAEGFYPHIISQYLLDTARIFTAFYQAIRVLDEKNRDLTAARLGLIESYSRVIKKGLDMLGIDVIERM
jgi:arginyl-tRNA synthetase